MDGFQEGIVTLCIGAIGMIGNIIAIPYFGSRMLRQKTFYILLTCLSICDLIVVINGMLLYGIPKVSNTYASETYFIIAPYVFPTFEMGSTGGIYFTMAICIERYFVVCRPLWYRAQAIASRTYTIPILVFSVVYNIPRFFEIKTVKIHPYNNGTSTNDPPEISTFLNDSSDSRISSDTTKSNEGEDEVFDKFKKHSMQNYTEDETFFQYSFEATELRQNVNYYGVYHIGCAIIFQFIIPLLVLIIANILILRQLIKHNNGPPGMLTNGGGGDGFQRTMSIHQHPSQLRRRRNQVDRAKVTLAICGIFLFCHLFKWVLNIYELYSRFRNNHLSEEEIENMINSSDWFIAVVNISNTLVILNSSINFYVYVLKDCWTKLTQKRSHNESNNTNNIVPEDPFSLVSNGTF